MIIFEVMTDTQTHTQTDSNSTYRLGPSGSMGRVKNVLFHMTSEFQVNYSFWDVKLSTCLLPDVNKNDLENMQLVEDRGLRWRKRQIQTMLSICLDKVRGGGR